MNRWLMAFSILIGFGVLGLISRTILFFYLEKIFARTATKIDDLFLKSLRAHILLWFLLGGLFLAVQGTSLSPRFLHIIEKSVIVGFFLSGSFALANFLGGAIRLYANQIAFALPATSLTENILRSIVLGIGVLLILSNLGISITPLLTALGVGSLAVALALQDTLSNLFAGLYILANRQIRVGDYIRLDSGQEGYVQDIGWRSTRIRELPGNIILIPNAKISQSIVTNYYLPDKEMAVLVQVGVSYASDLEKVQRVTTEVAKEVMQTVSGAAPNFEPFIRFHTFGDSSINFTVILRCKEYVEQHPLKHEFIKRLYSRYQKEGIVIPFPQRDVHLHPAN